MSDRLTEQEVANLCAAHNLGHLSDPILLSLLDEVQACRKLIADLRALHVAEVDDDDESPTQGETFCVNCEHENPCPTIRMIDEAGL